MLNIQFKVIITLIKLCTCFIFKMIKVHHEYTSLVLPSIFSLNKIKLHVKAM